jgi:hypothetical protein
MTIASSTWAKLGAASYVIWSVLHLQAAYSVYELGVAMAPSMAQGRVMQDAWNLLFFSITATGTAIFLNWRNSVWGYWINFGIISVADTGFIFFVLLPGHMGLWPGILAPIFWIAGLAFSTLGLIQRRYCRDTGLSGASSCRPSVDNM